MKPLNDSVDDGWESINLNLADDPDGLVGGSYLLAAGQPATTNPAAKPAAAAAKVGNIEALAGGAGDALPPNVAQSITDALNKLKSNDPAVRNQGENALGILASAYPTLTLRSTLTDAVHPTNTDYDADAKGRIQNLLNSTFPFSWSAGGVNSFTVNFGQPQANTRYIIEVSGGGGLVKPSNPGGDPVMAGRFEGAYGGGTPTIELIPLKSGSFAVLTLTLKKQVRDEAGPLPAQTIGTMKIAVYVRKLNN